MRRKATLCFLIAAVFASFFFARSVIARKPWITSTLMGERHIDSAHSRGSVEELIFVNNWLKDSPSKLFFGMYWYPASVEMPTLDKRGFYASFPPGCVLPIYILFKFLDATGIVPDIYEKRGSQIIAIIIFNYFIHFLLTLIVCAMVMIVCLKIGFDPINSMLLAIIPAIIQFHDSTTIFWNHFNYDHSSIVIIPYVLYVFLELLCITSTSTRVLNAVRIMQPLVMFYGIFTQSFFVFVMATVYIMRMQRKEIALPTSAQRCWHWLKQSFIFCSPALVAISFWLWQIIHYQRNVLQNANYLSAKVSSQKLTVFDNLLVKTGITGNASDIINWLQATLVDRMYHAYGIFGMLMLYVVFYLAIRARKFTNSIVAGKPVNLATATYLMLFIPCIANNLFFLNFSPGHPSLYLKFSYALSASFVFAPIFILQIMGKNYLQDDAQPDNRCSIALATLLGLFASVLYAFNQIHGSVPVTKHFTPPAYHEHIIGDFIRRHTDYYDVVFSSSYYSHPTRSGSFFPTFYSTKFIHYAHNLDHVYHKTKDIDGEFNIKIFFTLYQEKELSRLYMFAEYHHLNKGVHSEPRVGKILAFDGYQFRNWYEQVHECDVYPHHCREGSEML